VNVASVVLLEQIAADHIVRLVRCSCAWNTHTFVIIHRRGRTSGLGTSAPVSRRLLRALEYVDIRNNLKRIAGPEPCQVSGEFYYDPIRSDNTSDGVDVRSEIHNNMKDSDVTESGYHPDFNDPDANIVIKSEDGVSYRIHDYFLKASR
jgi:hypothetical protein